MGRLRHDDRGACGADRYRPRIDLTPAAAAEWVQYGIYYLESAGKESPGGMAGVSVHSLAAYAVRLAAIGVTHSELFSFRGSPA